MHSGTVYYTGNVHRYRAKPYYIPEVEFLEKVWELHRYFLS
jgi:hypothetical protein